LRYISFFYMAIIESFAIGSMDLSYKAMKTIDGIKDGVIDVRVEIME